MTNIWFSLVSAGINQIWFLMSLFGYWCLILIITFNLNKFYFELSSFKFFLKLKIEWHLIQIEGINERIFRIILIILWLLRSSKGIGYFRALLVCFWRLSIQIQTLGKCKDILVLPLHYLSFGLYRLFYDINSVKCLGFSDVGAFLFMITFLCWTAVYLSFYPISLL